ncbi:MAG: DUF3616 domain-containing protein [Enhydrobacter sp.]|nr:DUF3616 domain-containing protein [Enhydrobacter sp.]
MTEVERSRTHLLSMAFAIVITITAGLTCAAAAADDVDDAPMVVPENPGLVIQGFFAGKKKNDAAQDLSGIACRPPAAGGAIECLIVNDEGVTAQSVVIDKGHLTPGESVTLIGSELPKAALGEQPKVGCPKGPGGFKEFDGEGVTFAPGPAGGFFHIVGSHGCSRKKDEFRPSSFLLARVPVDSAGKLGAVELSWRVSEALDRTPPAISKKVGKSLGDDNGLNIEGIAAIGDRLLFGLRAPSVDEKGYIVSVPVAELFASGGGKAVGAPVVHELPLGKNVGVRDLAALPDGKLLVLSGPTLDQASVSYALSVYDPDTNRHRWLARLADIRSGDDRAKAEAVVVLGRHDDALRVLIMFDGIQNGGPQEYRLRY